MFHAGNSPARGWRRAVGGIALAGMALAAWPSPPAGASVRGSGGLSLRSSFRGISGFTPRSGFRGGAGFTPRSGFRGGTGFGHRSGFVGHRSGFVHRPGFVQRPGFVHRPAFKSNRFGLSFGDDRFRVHFGATRHFGHRVHRFHRPSFTSVYYLPPYFGGLYTYGGPFLSAVAPPYHYYPRSSTVYVYAPPVVRSYGGATAPGAAEMPAAPHPTPHPYEDPVAPTPEKGSVDEALTRIRTAWLREDLEVLSPHLPATGDIALYHDGDLRRELSPAEFTRLTREAVRETRTLSFRFTEVRRPAADEATATALHTYVGEGQPDAAAQTVTLRYDLIRRNDVWTLRAVHVGPMAQAREED